jgi:GntR family transcriptional regulator
MGSDGGTTKYAAVRDKLLTQILTMKVGDRLPSETMLCETYGVSRITIRQAVDGLVRDGRLSREQGRGTFVSEPARSAHYPERFADVVVGFYRQQTSVGNSVTTRVLRQELVPASIETAAQLDLTPGERVVELVRLRHVNGQLHQHVVTYLPYARCPDTLTADFSTGSLYDYLGKAYGIQLTRNDMTVRLDEATPEIALNLGVEGGIALLSLASTVFDQDGTPVAFGVARHTPDASEIAFSLRVAQPTQPSQKES